MVRRVDVSQLVLAAHEGEHNLRTVVELDGHLGLGFRLGLESGLGSGLEVRARARS